MKSRFPQSGPCITLTLLLIAARPAVGADSTAAPFQSSGVYPHLAALSDSYSESGIGAVVPWADRLWYVSYVAHKAGGGVGLYEITPELEIERRPESIVGTHAGRLVHRESNQLLIGPYVVDARRNVRVFETLAKTERVTAVMRHLVDPANLVYFMCMEGNLYEGNVHTLESRLVADVKKELEIRGSAHFKGGYTTQGRVVVANNSYNDQDLSAPSGEGRLAEWDGDRWTVVHRTAFCDVTTAGGIQGAPSDNAVLWAIGWDKRSVLLSTLEGGLWSTLRLPKGTQAYDHAWCTEWPRIRQIAPGRLLLDMHGMFYEISPDFAEGNAGGLTPISTHLRMVPDFCAWEGKLVMAGDENMSMNHRHRTGGQPQSGLWLGSADELKRWGPAAGWGGPWLNDKVQAGVPSEPFLIQGFARRTLHLSLDRELAPALSRCTGQFPVVSLPEELAGLDCVTVQRGSMEEPAPGFRFTVDRDVVVYLAVHDRGESHLPKGWEKTGLVLQWTHGGAYTDTIYKRGFPKGRIEIPGHDGHNELMHYGVPNMAFLRPAARVDSVASRGGELGVDDLPGDLDARLTRAQPSQPSGDTRFTVEVDRSGRGEWENYAAVDVPADGYAHCAFPDDLTGSWVRITADRDTVATAQFVFGPRPSDEPSRQRSALFDPFSRATNPTARIHGALLPFADRLWFSAYTTDADADGTAYQGGGLYEIDSKVRFTKRPESIPGVFSNRKMVGGLLSIGPHLIDAQGNVRTIEALRGEHVVASIRHFDSGKMFLLTRDGRLLEADLETLEVKQVVDVPSQLGLGGRPLEFTAGHLMDKTLLVAAVEPDGIGGCLAEWDGADWKLVDRSAYAEISNLGAMSETVLAVGRDAASAILRMRSTRGQWTTLRLPHGDPRAVRGVRTARPRIREVETERVLADVGGIFYEISGLTYALSIRPVATHNAAISDFCSWRGMTVLAGCDADAAPHANFVRGAENAGLWFGKTDDLWQFGPPTGQGGPWLKTKVSAHEPSDPYLMTNFEHRRVELSHNADGPVAFRLDVDFTVARDTWKTYKTIAVAPGKAVTHKFPDNYHVHWMRITVDRDCTATAQFVYE
jgi:hypothetical protein